MSQRPEPLQGQEPRQFDATPTMISGDAGCRMKSEGVEIALNGTLCWIVDRCYCGANFTGIIIERFEWREKQQGMLCGPCLLKS